MENVKKEDRIPGVTYDRKNERWGARWSAPDGRRAGKYFPVSQYGFEHARRMAIQCRNDAIREHGALRKQGKPSYVNKESGIITCRRIENGNKLGKKSNPIKIKMENSTSKSRFDNMDPVKNYLELSNIQYEARDEPSKASPLYEQSDNYFDTIKAVISREPNSINTIRNHSVYGNAVWLKSSVMGINKGNDIYFTSPNHCHDCSDNDDFDTELLRNCFHQGYDNYTSLDRSIFISPE